MDDSDLDPNAFLQSVRELKEKRQKEDNERYEQLEAQIKSSRLARKMERERDMTASPPASPSASPHKATATATMTPTSPSSGMPSRASTFSRQPRASRPMSVDLSPTRASSARPMSMVSIPEKGSPLPSLDSQRFAPSDADRPALARTMSSAQSRLDRPNSPTKGMGGFVQSAMLKRTDSVNKRWSNTAGPSALVRQDSTASIPEYTDARPTSSHSTVGDLNTVPEPEPKPLERPGRHSRSRSVASFSGQEPIPEGLMSPPLSPSKRWSRSPTKASWLESALARPESPKPSPQSAQPSWMAEITKAKQQRNSGENTLSHDSPKTQDSPAFGQGLLKRSSMKDIPPVRNVTPPTKAKPASLIGKPSLPELSREEEKPAATGPITPPPKKSVAKPKQEEPVDAKQEKPVEAKQEKPVEAKQEKPVEAKQEKPLEAKRVEPVASKDRTEKAKESVSKTESPQPTRAKSSDISPAPILPKLQSSDSTKFPTLNSPRTPALRSPEPKQDTTPKTDFRSGLKSRSGTIGAQTQDEPEFKAVFGKLKKAHTEKFVAPNELKSNILRGKAGLSLSAGPQKSERKDELKESLLKKKDEMKTKTVEKPVEPKTAQAPSSVPEALVIKKQLARSGSSLNVPAPEKQRRDITPEALSFHRNLKGKPMASLPEKPSSVSEKPKVTRSSTDEKASPPVDEEKPVEEPTAPLANKEEPKVAIDDQPKPAPSSKFADRFNPALAGLLARGPPQASNPATPRSGSPFSTVTPSRNGQSDQDQEPGEGTQLTHMTKSRARGPKRRKPAKANTAPAKSTPEKRISSVQSLKSEDTPPSSPAKLTPAQPRPKSAAVRAASINLSRQSSIELEKAKTPTPTKAGFDTPSSAGSEKPKVYTPSRTSLGASSTDLEKPRTPTPAKKSIELSSSSEKPKSPTPAKVSLSAPSSAVSDKPRTPSKSFATSSPLSTQSIPNVISPPSSSRNMSSSARSLPVKPLPAINATDEAFGGKSASSASVRSAASAEADKENQGFSVKGAASKWGRQPQQTPSPKRNTPIDLPTRRDEEAAMKSAGLLSNSPLRYTASPPRLGLGISERDSPKQTNGGDHTPPTSAGAPPRPAKSSRVVSGTLRDSLSAKDLPRIPDVLGIKTGRTLAAYFGDVPASSNELQLNTQRVLSSRSGESDKTNTLRKTIQEITVDGTLINLPAQEQHILYENSMYLCMHVFTAVNGARMTEFYLWCGDGVSEEAIQETQVHAKRVAKDAGAGQRSTSLFVVDQAREPANFFQALGGIVITRRSSRAESSTRAYMLCGRPHMGHIAFDEVDLSKASLCSEYPYIVARPVTLQETKVFLWKGSACGAEAIGSARLIGMDLNSTGDIVECEEGNESPEFLQIIGDSQHDVCKSPALWSRANARWEHSAVRLFRIEAAAPKQSAASLFTSFLSRRPSWSASPERPGSSSSNRSNSVDRGFEASVSEIAPFTQDDLEPEGCYVLDAGSAILVLPGILLPKSQLWKHAFTQALLFAHDYSILSASLDDRPAIPGAKVVLGALPREAKMKFRRWEEKRGLWGSGGLMAGKRVEEEINLLEVRDALQVCCMP